jgi:hypothetical protein
MNLSDWEHNVSDEDLKALLQVCVHCISVCMMFNTQDSCLKISMKHAQLECGMFIPLTEHRTRFCSFGDRCVLFHTLPPVIVVRYGQSKN